MVGSRRGATEGSSVALKVEGGLLGLVQEPRESSGSGEELGRRRLEETGTGHPGPSRSRDYLHRGRRRPRWNWGLRKSSVTGEERKSALGACWELEGVWPSGAHWGEHNLGEGWELGGVWPSGARWEEHSLGEGRESLGSSLGRTQSGRRPGRCRCAPMPGTEKSSWRSVAAIGEDQEQGPGTAGLRPGDLDGDGHRRPGPTLGRQSRDAGAGAKLGDETGTKPRAR